MIRIVRTEAGVKVDLTGKAPGRGAYIHANRSCWEKAIKGPIAHALKTEITDQDRQGLQEFMLTLPADPDKDSTRGSSAEADRSSMRQSA